MTSDIITFKLILIGESGVGKTSIISQFIEQTFQDDIESSSSGTFSSKQLIYGNDQILNLEIWDTAGQEKYRAIASMFYKEANGVILVYDITSKHSFEQLQEYWYEQIKEQCSSDIVFAICANKSDLSKEERVDEGEARNFAKNSGAIFCSTSAKNDYGITDLFIQIAKKYTNCDNVRIKTEQDDINIHKNYNNNERNTKKYSVKLTKDNKMSNKIEQKKKCC